jgi:chemotaxis protein histidine kinase CheA
MNFYSSKLQPPAESKWNSTLTFAIAWSEHTAEDGRTYYYNHATGFSTFVKPTDTSEEAFTMKPIGTNNPWNIVFTTKQHYFFFNKDTNWSGWFPPEDVIEQYISPMSKDQIMDLLDPTNAFTSESEVDEQHESDNEIEDDPEEDREEKETIQPEPKRQKVDEIPIEERTRKFKEMLRELDVSPYNPYETELQKFVNDERYKLLNTPKEIKLAFDAYCRERADELKDVLKSRAQVARDGYVKLLYEKVTPKTYFEDIYRLMKKNSIFMVLDKRECERMFKDHLKLVKEKDLLRKQEEAENNRQAFTELLQTVSITKNTKFEDIQSIIDKDPRFIAIKFNSERRSLFEDFKEKGDFTKTQIQPVGLKEKMKALKFADLDKQKTLMKQKEAKTIFKTLLIDFVKTGKVIFCALCYIRKI